jgi:hypothetical protein
MNYSYWRTERLILDAVDRRILRKTDAWDQIASILTSGDVVVLLAICMLGLLTSLAVFLAFPAFAEIAEVLQQL